MKLTEYDISHPYKATIVKSDRITDEDTDRVVLGPVPKRFR